MNIENEQQYQSAVQRYEEIRHVSATSPEHEEKMALVRAISAYEEIEWQKAGFPELTAEETRQIRKEEWGYAG